MGACPPRREQNANEAEKKQNSVLHSAANSSTSDCTNHQIRITVAPPSHSEAAKEPGLRLIARRSSGVKPMALFQSAMFACISRRARNPTARQHSSLWRIGTPALLGTGAGCGGCFKVSFISAICCCTPEISPRICCCCLLQRAPRKAPVDDFSWTWFYFTARFASHAAAFSGFLQFRYSLTIRLLASRMVGRSGADIVCCRCTMP